MQMKQKNMTKCKIHMTGTMTNPMNGGLKLWQKQLLLRICKFGIWKFRIWKFGLENLEFQKFVIWKFRI